MAQNTLGSIIKITSFGESHGPAVGVVIDGFPSGFKPDFEAIQTQMQRRRPGQSSITTQRNEADEVEYLSGIVNGETTGAPICLLIKNTDSKPADYDTLKDVYRPSHADYTYQAKYGTRDYKGGGRSSARITAAWVAAGALAEQYLKTACNMEIVAWVHSVYNIEANPIKQNITRALVDSNPVRCPDGAAAALMENEIEAARTEGDSLGGTIKTEIRNCPAGLGEPVFGKLQARLAQAIFSINAVKALEFGDGFNITQLKGSEANDSFISSSEGIRTATNHSGGIQGGISNGEKITFKVAFKPTSTIQKSQNSVNAMGEAVTISPAGRHDPCVVPRAVPIVEAMSAITLLDVFLEHKIYR